jgi:heterodisulfide reductase subunit A
VSGEPGEFAVTVRQRHRFVTNVCDRCALCRQVCPVVRPNEYDAGLSYRKAIFLPLRNGNPPIYAIDIESCLNDPPNYIPCNRCVQVCPVNAIRFDLPLERTMARDAAAIVFAAGFDLVDLEGLEAYGYGSHPDIVTSMELERLFASSGVTGGFAERPSNEQDPANVLFVVCDNSAFTWTYAARQISRLNNQAIEDITLLYEQAPAGGAEPLSFLKGAATHSVHLVRGASQSIKPNGSGAVHSVFRDQAAGKEISKDFELVVLATAVRPPASLAALADVLGIEVGPDGYVKVESPSDGGAATSRPGVYAAGCVSGPKNIQATVTQCASAVRDALKLARIRVQPLPGQPDLAPSPAPLAGTAPGMVAPHDLQARIQNVVLTLLELGQKALEKK